MEPSSRDESTQWSIGCVVGKRKYNGNTITAPATILLHELAHKFAASSGALAASIAETSQTILDGDVKLASFEDLAYPPIARSTGIQGVVVVEVTIDDRGDVVNAVAVSGAKLLLPEALANAKRWRFRPGPGKEAVIVYDFRSESGGCHDSSRSLFCLRHANLATITSCESVIQP